MHSKFIGGILLIIGTSIGAGMLALPLVTSQVGVFHAFLLFIGAWYLMTMAATFILKVNLTLPHGTNMISMAKHTLGKPGELVTWVSYLLLLYCLLSAYIAGGADLLTNLVQMFHLGIYHWLAVVIFVLIFGAIVFKGIRVVDMANRGLMTVKLGSFIVLVLLLMSHLHWHNFHMGSFSKVPPAVLVVITSFGYAVIIPSLRDYFGEDDHMMMKAVWIGSLVPLVCYTLWIIVVLGVLPQSTHIAGLSSLVNKLSLIAHSDWVTDFVHLFTYICITTSFLGVSLSLTDFIADGFKLAREGKSLWVIMVMAFAPPMIMVLFYPAAFIHGLALAGVFCIILLMLLPALMVLKLKASKPGVVWFEILAAIGLLVFAVTRL
ncbi:MAG: tryptophan/tyrosine permease [Coxiella sp. (in: Bacteria)]|nr:MAG: tryptophan/tyrosine permease [Coxiella sp. (in: g-proteobacteria)]